MVKREQFYSYCWTPAPHVHTSMKGKTSLSSPIKGLGKEGGREGRGGVSFGESLSSSIFIFGSPAQHADAGEQKLIYNLYTTDKSRKMILTWKMQLLYHEQRSKS